MTAKKKTTAAAKKTPIAKAMANGLRYIGKSGKHLHGIPARDLAPAEVHALTVIDLDQCLKSGIYKIIGDNP